jgi:hypothetical protein
MLCEYCKKEEATVHVTGWDKLDASSGQAERKSQIERHFCRDCAVQLEQTSPLLNPLLAAGPGARKVVLRVMSVNPDRLTVRTIPDEPGQQPEEWSFLTSRLDPSFAVAGVEFEMILGKGELDWLRGL